MDQCDLGNMWIILAIIDGSGLGLGKYGRVIVGLGICRLIGGKCRVRMGLRCIGFCGCLSLRRFKMSSLGFEFSFFIEVLSTRLFRLFCSACTFLTKIKDLFIALIRLDMVFSLQPVFLVSYFTLAIFNLQNPSRIQCQI